MAVLSLGPDLFSTAAQFDSNNHPVTPCSHYPVLVVVGLCQHVNLHASGTILRTKKQSKLLFCLDMFGKLSQLARKVEEAVPDNFQSQIAQIGAKVGEQVRNNPNRLHSLPAWAQSGLTKLVEMFPAPANATSGQQLEHTQNQAASGFLQGTGKRRALFIGINYIGMQGELRVRSLLSA